MKPFFINFEINMALTIYFAPVYSLASNKLSCFHKQMHIPVMDEESDLKRKKYGFLHIAWALYINKPKKGEYYADFIKHIFQRF